MVTPEDYVVEFDIRLNKKNWGVQHKMEDRPSDAREKFRAQLHAKNVRIKDK